MQVISSNMDKLLAHIQRDIRFRKANRKIQDNTSHPKDKPQNSPTCFNTGDLQMKDGLKDEERNIMQMLFYLNQRKV